MNGRLNLQHGAETVPPRVLTAMITPFAESGRLNWDGTQQLADYLTGSGSDGLVLAGTTGESPTLTIGDHLDLFDVVRTGVGPDVPLIGGTGSNNTEEAINLTREATRRGSLDAILVVTPYYNRPSQYGIDHYFREVSEVTDLPIILYNIPVRTGRAAEIDTISRLAEDGVIAGLKDATGDTIMAESLNERFSNELAIYSGDDSLNLAFAERAGAVGAISVASHWAGRLMARMFAAHFAGDHEQAARISVALMPSCEFESTHTDESGRFHDTPNPIPAKVMVGNLIGTDVVGECLPPMVASPQEMDYLWRRTWQILAGLEKVE